MIDMKTGIFNFGQGKTLYPKMSKNDFFNNKELVKEIKKGDKNSPILFLGVQKIGEFNFSMTIQFNNQDEVQLIIMQKPNYFDGEHLLTEEQALNVKKYQDEFLKNQMLGECDSDFKKLGKNEWGWVKSIYEYIDIPRIQIQLAYL